MACVSTHFLIGVVHVTCKVMAQVPPIQTFLTKFVSNQLKIYNVNNYTVSIENP